MLKKTLTLPPGYFPPLPFSVHGEMRDGETFYTCRRQFGNITLPIVFVEGAATPENFQAYFSECAGEEPKS